MSYGPNRRNVHEGLAVYVDKILNGAQAADLPIEPPTRFELVIDTAAGTDPRRAAGGIGRLTRRGGPEGRRRSLLRDAAKERFG
jgi:hypothetical protein